MNGDHRRVLSKTEQAYHAIREAIYTGRLQPGERLAEEPLAIEYGMSRTPVREALKRLEVEGWAEFVHHRGMVVSSPSAEDLAELFVVREALEGLAARLAATSRTEAECATLRAISSEIERATHTADTSQLVELNNQFHSVIWQASRNRYLAQELAQLRRMITGLQPTTLTNPGRKDEMVEEVRELLDAIEKRDGERAERLSRAHSSRAEEIRMLSRGISPTFEQIR